MTVQERVLRARAHLSLRIAPLPGGKFGEWMREDERMWFDGGCKNIGRAGGSWARSSEWWEARG